MTITFTITRARLPLIGLVALVIALMTAGAVLSARTIAGGSEAGHGHGTAPNGPLTAGQGIPTSFGAVAVEYAVRLSGLTSKDLNGMTHGVKNYVPPESSQVQVAVTLANQLPDTLDYDPAQFRLIAGTEKQPAPDARRQRPTGASFRPGTLQPDAAIEGTLSFVVPNKRAHLWVEFRDPARKRPLLVDLGPAERTLPGSPTRSQPETPAPPTSFDGTSPRDAHGSNH
jgi:hypothetical protein